MAFNQFPYSNFHELNLDWILSTLKNLKETMGDFVDLNTLKFANPIEWSIDRYYANNTIVTSSGNTYISRKPVPAGVDINNPDYWVLTGNYNAQIGVLENMVDVISETFANKKILIVGDSISDENMTDAPARNPVWVVHFREMVSKFGATVTNMSKRGRGFQITADGQTFSDVVNSVNLNNFDIVIVFGGINDFLQGTPPGVYGKSTAGTMWTGVKAVAEAIKVSSAKCYFISPLSTNVRDNFLDYCTPDVYRAIIAGAARAYGFNFINGGRIPPYGSEANKTVDGLHPLGTSTKELARYIFNKMLYGSEDFIPVAELFSGTVSGTNFTATAMSTVISANEMVFDWRGTATGPFEIQIPNDLGIYTGQVQMVAGIGGNTTYMITGHSSIKVNGMGSGVSGNFHIQMRGLSDSLCDFNWIQHPSK